MPKRAEIDISFSEYGFFMLCSFILNCSHQTVQCSRLFSHYISIIKERIGLLSEKLTAEWAKQQNGHLYDKNSRTVA